jgi:flagella synthesis protein FlgN
MSLVNFSLQRLDECLREEIHAMASLAKLLKIEETALVDGNVNDLSRLTQDKSQLIIHLSKLEVERKTCLDQHGYSSDTKGMQDYISSAPSTSMALEDWSKLLQLSEQAKETNRTNGVLINRQFSRNQTALNILQKNNPTGSLYGPTGQATNSSSSGRGFVVG